MYQFLLDRFGPRLAYWGTVAWFVVLLALVFISTTLPAGEFRYGKI